MTPDHDSPAAHEPLLLPSLIQESRNNAAGDGSITRIMRGLMSSPTTDAERAGERLRAYGWELTGDGRSRRWNYRVVGEQSGRTLVQFTLSVPGSTSELPCRVLGLQLQITLNGLEATPPDELDAYLELAGMAAA